MLNPCELIMINSLLVTVERDETSVSTDQITLKFSLLSEFVASSQYFQSSLSTLPPSYRKFALRQGRFEERWQDIQEWIPKRLISYKQRKIQYL